MALAFRSCLRNTTRVLSKSSHRRSSECNGETSKRQLHALAGAYVSRSAECNGQRRAPSRRQWLAAQRCLSSRSGSDKQRQDKERTRVTREQISFFLKQGYLVLEDFWDDNELSAIRRELERLQTKGKLSNVSTVGDGETHTNIAKNLQLCPLSPESDLFRSLPFSPKVSATLADLLLGDSDDGDDALRCYLSQVFWKPAKHGSGTSWHQDNIYFNVTDCQHCTAMWTAVHDATKENGALEVIPGAWQQGLLPHLRDGFSDHHVTCQDSVEEAQAVTLELKAGGVAFFNYLTPHCTRGNSTDRPRAGVAYHFLPAAQYRPREFPLPPGADWVAPVIWDGDGCCYGQPEYGCRQDFASDVKSTLL